MALILWLRWMPIHLPGLPLTHALEAFGTGNEDGPRPPEAHRRAGLQPGAAGEHAPCVTAADDDLPERLKSVEQVPGDPRTRVPLAPMKRQYYRLRGWTPDGVPTLALLRRLRIQQEVGAW